MNVKSAIQRMKDYENLDEKWRNLEAESANMKAGFKNKENARQPVQRNSCHEVRNQK